MDVRTINLTANVALRQAIPHRFFMLVATSAALQVRKLAVRGLSLVDETARSVEAGYKYFPLDPQSQKGWGGFELLSTVNQTVTVGVSNDAGDYASVLQTIRLEQATDGETAADQAVGVASSEIAAANADRVRAIVQNTGANAIRVGDSAVTAARGILLNAGGSVTFNHTGAIHAIRVAADSTVAVLEETR